MLVITKVKMDLHKPAQTITMEAVQNDCNTRCVEAELLCDGLPWQIPQNAVIAMRYRKLDGTQGYYDTLPDGSQAWSVNGNTVSVILAPQMLTVPGTVVAQLELMQDSRILASGVILVSVLENPGAGAVPSEDYIHWTQWMQQQLEEYLHQALESGDMVGPAGEPAVLISSSVTYQAGTSGTEIPEGEWQDRIPEVASGSYLWTKTVYTFNSGDPVIQYSVSLSGGAGGIASVAGISPDLSGNVPLTAADIGAVSHQYAQANYHNYENRIDNSDFTRFVAQAGVGGKHGTQAYAGDRWILDSGTVTGEENSSGDGYTNINLNGTIRQIVANPPAVGTVFVEMISGTAEAAYENGEVTVTSAGGIIKNVALYEGEFEENTRPVYQPKGYAAEWTECLRYFLKPDPNNWNFAFTAANGAYLVFEIPCPVKMRVLPSIVSQGALKLYAGAGWNTVTVSSWTRYFHGGKYSMFASKASVSGIDISTAASYMMTGTPALSADL